MVLPLLRPNEASSLKDHYVQKKADTKASEIIRAADLIGIADCSRKNPLPKARLHLLGPMQLRDAEGRDCTPRGSLMQALLAVLALSSQGKRTRTKIQDLLWSESDSIKAAQSLRTAISRLRQFLQAQSLNILEVGNDSLWLNRVAVNIDVLEYIDGAEGIRALHCDFPTELPELLEGLNFRSANGEEFESWLRNERRLWGDRLERIHESDTSQTGLDRSSSGSRGRPGPCGDQAHVQALVVGLLPSVARHRSPDLAFLADDILEGLATALRDVALVDIYDYRESSKLFSRRDAGLGPDILLRVRTEDCGDQVLTSLVAYRSDNAKLLWKWSVKIPQSDKTNIEMFRFINEAVDRVCDTLVEASRSRSSRTSPYHALNVMFRFDADSLMSVHNMLEAGHKENGDSVYLSLLAYLNSFRVGEHWLDFNDEIRRETQQLVDAVIESNPFNSLTLAMTGHACGYILHNHDLAIDLIERSTRLNGSLAVCWDHLALNYLYVGRVEDAEKASAMAISLGAFSPLRFTYDATMCMICTIRGDYAQAVLYGQRSLARRPNFGAALRYTAVSLAHLGRAEEAHQIVAHIRALSPDFSADWVRTNRLAVSDGNIKSRLFLGLQKAGA